MTTSPFKFLDSYTCDDRAIFFGRDREIEELYQRVFESKLMLVYGISGTGKSSLIHCGLANKFNETDWLPLVIRRGGNIIESMSAGIKAVSITSQQSKFVSPVDFKKAVRSLYLDYYKPVFFIFDQFEELFIFGDKEERRNFVQIVKSLIESDLQCRLIFVMREEYMAGITEFERFIPTFFANRVRIEKMSHINALEAIKEPCKVFNISLEEGFAEALLEKLSPGGTDVELTYLQVFLDRIFKLAQDEKGYEQSPNQLSFALPLLEKTGNVSDLLGNFLDEQISLLRDPETALAVLKSFVSVKGTKRQMTSEEVKDYSQTLGKPIEESVLLEMLQTFVHLRILRDKDQNERYELRHDAIAIKIYEKFTAIEKEILEIRQFIDNAWNNWQKRNVLISGTDLNYLAPYESRLYLPYELSGLIKKSKNELNRIKKRRWAFLVTAGLLIILILSAFTAWAFKERSKAISALKAKEIIQEKLNAAAYNFVITADKMNVFYKGVNNPFSWAIPGWSEGSFLRFDLPGLMFVDTITGRKMIRLDTIGLLNITVYSKIGSSIEELGTRSFRVMNLPDPIANLNGETNGLISRENLIKMEGINTQQVNVDFECLFKVLSYKITCQIDGKKFTTQVVENKITDSLRLNFKKISTNSIIVFSEIKVIGSDNVTRILENLTLTVI